jgi:carboxyl-terminal processing protease
MMALSHFCWAVIVKSLMVRLQIGLALFFSFFAGLTLPFAQASLTQNLASLQELSVFIQKSALIPKSESVLWQGASQGLLSSLGDPYSYYLSPDEYAEIKQIKTGDISGLGIEVTIQNDVLTVISAVDNSPAWRAGLQAGDIIRQIGTKKTAQMAFAEALQSLQGELNSWVELTIERPSSSGLQKFRIRREKLDLNPVHYRVLAQNIGYIRLSTFFSDQVPEAMQEALSALEQSEVKGLILDLRNNPGGTISNAIEVCSIFLPQGNVVRVVDRQNKETVHTVTGLALVDPGLEVVVLVNKGTASASEIVAGSLQEYGRAILVGQSTFGKGLVQSLLPLSSGAGVSLTTHKYLTAYGYNIHGKGIQPDLDVAIASGVILGSEQDQQLEAALGLFQN